MCQRGDSREWARNPYHTDYGAYDRTRGLLLAAHVVQIAADEP
jgi:hypothetical protein